MAIESPPQVWRYHPTSLRLIGSNCEDCGELHYPARAVCPKCRHIQTLPGKRDILPQQQISKPASK